MPRKPDTESQQTDQESYSWEGCQVLKRPVLGFRRSSLSRELSSGRKQTPRRPSILDAGTVMQKGEPLFGMSTSNITVPAHVLATLPPIQLPENHPGKQQMTAQVVESLPPREETQMESLSPRVSLAQQHVRAMSEVNQGRETSVLLLCVSLSHSLPFK